MNQQTIVCSMCGEREELAALVELREMGEAYHHEKGCYLCPDCWDAFQRMPLEQQLRVAITNGWKGLQKDEGRENQ